MANPTTLQDNFVAGVKKDLPRSAMPKGSFWDGADLIPNFGAPLRERGGWSNGSDAITKPTASYVSGGIFAPFTAGSCQVVLDEDGEVYKVSTDTTVVDVGAGTTIAQNPVFHRDMVIIPCADGTTTPKKVTNSAGVLTAASLSGSPPAGIYAAVWGDYTLLGNTDAEPQRLYFSDPGDPETWDTTNVFWDFTQPINGLASMRSAILAFHDGTISRLRGTTPPPNGDFFADDPIFTVGCSDARSIAMRGDRVVFANGEGIFYTDGSAEPANITALCGMQSYWQEKLSGYTKTSWTISGGFLRDKYFVSVMNGSTFVLAAFVDLAQLSWWPLTNIEATSMWVSQGSVDELYFGRRDAARVGKLSSVFMPAAGVKSDADGTAVAATFESPYYEGQAGEKTWKVAYVDHELFDYAADNPAADLFYLTTPESTTYTQLTTGLTETLTKSTSKVVLGLAADGIAFKIRRSAAGDFRLYRLEAEVQPRERSRRAT